MLMKSGERWRCSNADCHREVLVESGSTISRAGPLCICGGIMKRNDAPPAFRYLDFLRVDDAELRSRHCGTE
jgi:hypothetical protein